VGLFGCDDLVALEQATLDLTSTCLLIEENIPSSMEVFFREGHPFRQLHGPLKDPYRVVEYAQALGIGSRSYELVDVLPLESVPRSPIGYIPAR
jgi:uncharacterized Fe-S center protein